MSKIELPEACTERVGETISYLEHAAIGETIQFTYENQRGEESLRNVLVTEVNEDEEYILAWDYDKEDYRRFNDSNRYGLIHIVEPVEDETLIEKVRFDTAMASVTTDELVAVYQARNPDYLVEYDEETGSIVVSERSQEECDAALMDVLSEGLYPTTPIIIKMKGLTLQIN